MPDTVDIAKEELNAQTADELASYVDRIINLEEEKASLGTDIKDIYKEAAGRGFPRNILTKVVKMKREDEEKREERENDDAVASFYLEVITESAEDRRKRFAKAAKQKRDRTREETGQTDVEDVTGEPELADA